MTQMGILSTALLQDGWHVIVHREDGSDYEIVLGTGNARTKREIKPQTSIYRLWRAGKFD